MASWRSLFQCLLAELVEAAAAEVVLVGHALLAPGMVAEFEAGAEMAIGEERRAHAGAQREHQLHAFAFDGSVALRRRRRCPRGRASSSAFRAPPAGESPSSRGCRLTAVYVVPCLMTPGKPTETRSNLGSSLRSSSRPFEHGGGRGDCGREHALALADRLAVGGRAAWPSGRSRRCRWPG